MLVSNLLQPLVLLVVVVLLTPPLGAHMARVMGGERTFLHPVLGPVERLVYRSLRLAPDREQTWKAYARSLVIFSLASVVGLYILERIQGLLPVNPDGFGAVDPYLALNTAVSFVTNSDWQNYVGEQTMSHLTQMAGLAVQNFVSAFAGLTGNTPFYNLAGTLALWAGRFLPIVAVLAIAGSLAAKETVPAGPGTFPTHTPLFVGVLVSVLVVGALTFFPVLALGPLVEHLIQATGQLF